MRDFPFFDDPFFDDSGSTATIVLLQNAAPDEEWAARRVCMIRLRITACKRGTPSSTARPAWASGPLATLAARRVRGTNISRNITPTPAFIGETDVTDGIHWQAVREGIEDYEYLAMLRDAVALSKNGAWKASAQKVLEQGPSQVIGEFSPVYAWKPNPRVDAADVYRLKVLSLLETAK